MWDEICLVFLIGCVFWGCYDFEVFCVIGVGEDVEFVVMIVD